MNHTMRYTLLILLFPLFSQTQIVNIEKLRLSDTLENHLSFEAELGVALSKNSSGDVLAGSGSIRTDYYFNKKNKLLLLGAFGINRFKASDAEKAKVIEDNQFIHLRYNRKLTGFLTWEAFAQGQFNEVELINLRLLMGSGLRFRILNKDKGYIYLGTMYMFESSDEVFNSAGENIQFNHHRLSNYISMLYQINESAGISHVTYVQPKLDEMKDIRVSSETGLEFKLFKKITWKTYLRVLYDSKPPIGVVDLRYELRNSIGISF